MHEILASIDNRELALAAWIAIAICLCLAKRDLRRCLGAVVRAAMAWKIVVLVSIAAAYTVTITILFYAVGGWSLAQLNISVLWLLFAALPSITGALKASDNLGVLKSSVIQSFKLSIVLEFFINFYTFPLLAEFILVPVMAILACMLVFSERDEGYQLVHKFLSGVISIITLALLIFGAYQLANNYSSFANIGTLRAFLLPIIYNITFVPFLWGVAICAAYEEVFCRLPIFIKNTSLQSFARRKLVCTFRGNVKDLNGWFRAVRLDSLTSRSDIVQSISSYVVSRDVA